MAKFRKKPVVIDAWLFDGSWRSASPIIQRHNSMSWTDSDGGKILIETLEGTMFASPGDWIIKGVAGEFYPIKNDIFLETYEAIEPDIFAATYEAVADDDANKRRGSAKRA